MLVWFLRIGDTNVFRRRSDPEIPGLATPARPGASHFLFLAAVCALLRFSNPYHKKYLLDALNAASYFRPLI